MGQKHAKLLRGDKNDSDYILFGINKAGALGLPLPILHTHIILSHLAPRQRKDTASGHSRARFVFSRGNLRLRRFHVRPTQRLGSHQAL